MDNIAMEISLVSMLQIISVLLNGLVAGLFYSFDCSVVKGLGNLRDREYLGAFQSLNKAILNPYFFISFMGSLFVLPIAAWFTYQGSPSPGFYFLLAASLIYIIGVFGVTALGNIPLNNKLRDFELTTANTSMIQNMRLKFESSWNALHRIRTYASILAFILTILSMKFVQ